MAASRKDILLDDDMMLMQTFTRMRDLESRRIGEKPKDKDKDDDKDKDRDKDNEKNKDEDKDKDKGKDKDADEGKGKEKKGKDKGKGKGADKDKDKGKDKGKDTDKDSDTDKDEGKSYSFRNPDPDVLRWDSNGSLVPYNGRNITLLEGWLKVPLVHDPHLSELTRSPDICLRVRGIPSDDSSAPNGPLFLHCGGPSSGHDCVTMGVGPPAKVSRKFDQWSISQRGIDPPPRALYGLAPFKECPFKGAHEISPIACGSTTKMNKSEMAKRLGIKADDPLFDEVISPIANNRGLDGVTLMNKTFVHWFYHLVKLEQELCYHEPRYQLKHNVTHNDSRTFNTLDYVATLDLVADMDMFRKAIGAPKLSLWGMSYGTSVAATYATLFNRKVKRLVLDANVPPYPDIHKRALEAAIGGQSVWNGIASECGNSLAEGLEKSQRCPAAPDATTKMLSVVRGKDHDKAKAMYQLTMQMTSSSSIGQSLHITPSLRTRSGTLLRHGRHRVVSGGCEPTTPKSMEQHRMQTCLLENGTSSGRTKTFALVSVPASTHCQPQHLDSRKSTMQLRQLAHYLHTCTRPAVVEIGGKLALTRLVHQKLKTTSMQQKVGKMFSARRRSMWDISMLPRTTSIQLRTAAKDASIGVGLR